MSISVDIYFNGNLKKLQKQELLEESETPSDSAGGVSLAISQAPLTITNAILSTSLLMKDLVHRDAKPDKLLISIGLINLTSVPFGGFPMCHGAGSLATQYRFGARTGGSNIISGMILLPIALFFASPEFVAIIPLGVFWSIISLCGYWVREA